MFNFFRKKKENSPETKGACGVTTGGQQQIILQDNDFLNFALGYGAGLTGYENISYRRAMMFYQQSSSVATAVDITTQEMGRIKPVLEQPDGTLTDKSPVLDRLKNPNDWNEDFNYFFSSMGKSYLLTGDCFNYAGGLVNRPPVELYVPKPQNVNNITGTTDHRPSMFTIYNGDGIGTYTRSREKTGYRFYDGNLKELWQTSMYSSSDSNYRGDSPLKAICLDINSQIAGRLHNYKLLEHGGRPTGLLIFKEVMTQDQYNERRQNVNEQIAGADNAGKIIVSGGTDFSYQELAKTNRDMDYPELERIADMAVYRRYRIPLPLVFMDNTTMNNMEHSVYHLYDFAVLPRVDELFASLSMFLLPRYGLDPGKYRITYNPEEIDALKERRVEQLLKRKQLGIESINELREGIPGREPVENGDDIYVPSTAVPIGEVSTEYKEQEATAEEEAEALAERDGVDV